MTTGRVVLGHSTPTRGRYEPNSSGAWASVFGESQYRLQSEREAAVRAEWERSAASVVMATFEADPRGRGEVLAMLGLPSPVTAAINEIQALADDINERLGRLVEAGRAA